jgi:hypothetical protein
LELICKFLDFCNIETFNGFQVLRNLTKISISQLNNRFQKL